jgi:chaperonin cofactor prefoldin
MAFDKDELDDMIQAITYQIESVHNEISTLEEKSQRLQDRLSVLVNRRNMFSYKQQPEVVVHPDY